MNFIRKIIESRSQIDQPEGVPEEASGDPANRTDLNTNTSNNPSRTQQDHSVQLVQPTPQPNNTPVETNFPKETATIDSLGTLASPSIETEPGFAQKPTRRKLTELRPVSDPAVQSVGIPQPRDQNGVIEALPENVASEVETFLNRIDNPAPQLVPEIDEPDRAGPELTELAASQRAVSIPASPSDQSVESQPIPDAMIAQVGRRSNRAKTRLLGFESMSDGNEDPFESGPQTAQPQSEVLFPVGWIVVVDGPGRGRSFTLQNGVSQIGRGEDQAIRLNMGDTSISRSNHAAIAYDHVQHKFFLGHGGKANLVRLNGGPLLSTEEISDGDIIDIGETKLHLVALCSAEFNWGAGDLAP